MFLYRPHDPPCVAPPDQTRAAVDAAHFLCRRHWVCDSHFGVWFPDGHLSWYHLLLCWNRQDRPRLFRSALNAKEFFIVGFSMSAW